MPRSRALKMGRKPKRLPRVNETRPADRWARLGTMTLDEARHRYLVDDEFFKVVAALTRGWRYFRRDEIESAVDVAADYGFHDLRRLIDRATAAGEPVPDDLRVKLDELQRQGRRGVA